MQWYVAALPRALASDGGVAGLPSAVNRRPAAVDAAVVDAKLHTSLHTGGTGAALAAPRQQNLGKLPFPF